MKGTLRVGCDNQASINIANNVVRHNRIKHVKIDVGVISLTHVKSRQQIAKCLTKILWTKDCNLACVKMELIGIYHRSWGECWTLLSQEAQAHEITTYKMKGLEETRPNPRDPAADPMVCVWVLRGDSSPIQLGISVHIGRLNAKTNDIKIMPNIWLISLNIPNVYS
jgi:hypothetical protein